jgi:hypothetical protein
MENMNTVQGTVFGRPLLTETLEALTENLESYKVTKIERIESMRDGRRSPNGLHILTFATRNLPEHILCGYERFAVRQYYPNPLRCMMCCQYGHTKNWCKTKEEPICKNCGKEKHENDTECPNPKKCVNCKPPNDKHGSFDKDCQTRIKENIIIRMKIDRGISYGMARKIFDQKIDHEKQSYAEAAGNFAEKLAREEANQLESIRQKRMTTEKLLQEAEEENKKLKAALEKLLIIKEENNKLKTLKMKTGASQQKLNNTIIL